MIDSSTHYNVIQCRRLHGNNSKNVADAQSRKLHGAAAAYTRPLLKNALRGIADLRVIFLRLEYKFSIF